MKKYLIILTIILFSCNYKSKKNIIIQTAINQSIKNIEFQNQKLKDRKNEIEDLKDSKLYFGKNDRIEKQEKKVKAIELFYNSKISQIENIINSNTILSKNSIIEIQDILNYNFDSLEYLFIDTTERRKSEYLLEYFSTFKATHNGLNLSSFKKNTSNLNEQLQFLYVYNSIEKVIEEKYNLIDFFYNQLSIISCSIHFEPKYIAFIERTITLPNDSNKIVLGLNFESPFEYYIDEELIGTSFYPIVYYKFKNPNRVGTYSKIIKMKFIDHTGEKAIFEKTLTYQVVNSYQ